MGDDRIDRLTEPGHLRDTAYHDESLIRKRQALYEFTFPRYVVDDEAITLLELSKARSLLDVGCGGGRLVMKVADHFPSVNVLGVDIASGMFEAAQVEAEKRQLSVKFQVEDVQQLSFPDNSFDRVSALHMIYHAPDIPSALAELKRVVIPHGLVLLTVNSVRSKPALREMKKEVAAFLGGADYPDTTSRFNLENGVEALRRFFSRVEVIPFESRLRLSHSQPYVDYFDSTRDFWSPYPSDESWRKALAHVQQRVDKEIVAKGRFDETNLFGALLAFP